MLTSDIVGHDVVFLVPSASRTGAPIALLELLRWLRGHSDLEFRIVLYQDGPLAADFQSIAPTVILTEIGVGRSRLVRRIGKIPILGSALKHLWHGVVSKRAATSTAPLFYANSVAAASLLRQLVSPGAPLVVHVHELQWAIDVAAGVSGMATIKSLATRYVASTPPVRENLIATHGIDPSLIDLIPYFIPMNEALLQKTTEYRRRMREQLGIPLNAIVIGGCGSTSWRKGSDLFVEMGILLHQRLAEDPPHLVWVGGVTDDDFTRSMMNRIAQAGIGDFCHFTGVHPNVTEVFCGFDVFVLSSREEPMGLVGLHAATVSCPIVCFVGAGGMAEFVERDCGIVVSAMTAEALADAVLTISTSTELRDQMGRNALAKVRVRHRADNIGPQMLDVIRRAAMHSRPSLHLER